MIKKFFNLNNFIEYGLYLLVFLLPIQTRWIIKAGQINGGYSEYATISLYGTDILLLCLLIIFIFSIFNFQFSNKSQFLISNIKNYGVWLFIGILELAAFLSIFFASDKILALYGYLRLLLGIGLFWILMRAVYDRIKLIWFFIAGAFFQACLGIWQFLIQSTFSSKWLGMASHDPAMLGTSVVEIWGGERWLRAYGGLDHPNILGGFLAVAILLSVFLFMFDKFRISNFEFQIKHEFLNFKFFTFYFLLLTLLSAIFFTFSRAAWAAAIIGILAMLIAVFVKKDFFAQKKILEVILASSVLLFILFSLYGDLAITRLSRDTRLEIKSNEERVASYKESWPLIKKHWLFGAGINNYVLAEESAAPGKPSYYYQPVHNVFLLAWAETGTLGLIGFVGLLISLLFRNLKFRNCLEIKNWELKIGNIISSKKHNYKYLSIILAVTIFLSLDHWLWSLHFGVLFFWLISGLAFCQKES